MTNAEIATITQAVLAALQAQGQTSVKSVQPAGKFAKKDHKTLRGFARKGIKDVVLMDRGDRAKPYNVKPFKAWLADGRMVRKGEHGVNGLFHVSQTDAVKADTSKLATKFKLADKSANDNQPSA